ncbi:MAG: hypothetical protein HEP71_05075 [Roseivirga sp.]|nr:hypothetical protein [Roseivirga sp.]
MKYLCILISIIASHTVIAQKASYKATQTPVKYSLDYLQESAMTVGNGEPKKSNRSVHLGFSVDGKTEQDSLVGNLHFTKSDARQKLQMGLQKVDTRNLNNKSFRFSVPLKGGSIKTQGKNPGVVLGTNAGGIMKLDDLFSYQFPELPDAALKIGLEWKTSLVRGQIVGVATITPELSLNHKITGMEQVMGIECYRIETNTNFTHETEVKIPQHPTPFDYEGTGAARLIWFFDPINGQVVKLTAIENASSTIGMATISQETTIELVMVK